MMTPREVLQKASKLIASETQWVQGRYATNKYGNGVSPLSVNACNFCMTGAVIATVKPQTREEFILLGRSLLALAKQTRSPTYFRVITGLAIINDTGTFEDVHRILDGAILNFQTDSIHVFDQDLKNLELDLRATVQSLPRACYDPV